MVKLLQQEWNVCAAKVVGKWSSRLYTLTYDVAWLGDSELASCAFYSKQVHAWGMAGMDQLARQS